MLWALPYVVTLALLTGMALVILLLCRKRIHTDRYGKTLLLLVNLLSLLIIAALCILAFS